MVNDFLNLVICFDELVFNYILLHNVFIDDFGLVFGYKICVDCLLADIELNMNEAVGYLWVEYQ